MKKLIVALMALIATTVWASAATLGDDGLHKEPWMRDTFKDLRDDLAEANAEGKRLMVIIEQRGCIYCKKMHEEVFSVEEVGSYITDNFFVVQINITPMILFMPQEVAEDASAARVAVATMPGAFGRHTTFNMLSWVVEKGYEGDEPFQKYHARKFGEGNE